jgi:hypothetical protein
MESISSISRVSPVYEISNTQRSEIFAANNANFRNLKINNEKKSENIFFNESGDSYVMSEDAKREIEKEKSKESINEEISDDEKKEVESLKKRDREVRIHEQAHIAASGNIPVSGPVYTFKKGPDGNMYVVDGHVNFTLPKGNTPDEKLQIAQQLRRLALAPANPSSKDRQVAAKASEKINSANKEKREENLEKIENVKKSDVSKKSQPLEETDKKSDFKKSNASVIYERSLEFFSNLNKSSFLIYA